MSKRGKNKRCRDEMSARRAWMFSRQEGRCYLARTDACRARGAKMRLDLKGAACGVRRDFATLEHVIPRSMLARYPVRMHLVLLACADCNTAKGSRKPEPEHVERAIVFAREWCALNVRGRTPLEVAEIERRIEAVAEEWRRRSVQATMRVLESGRL